MYNFGKFTAEPKTFEVKDEEGNVISTATVICLFDVNGVEWHDCFTLHPHPWYIAVTDANLVCSMESDPEQSQIAGVTLIGIDSDFGYTRGAGGTVYGKYWDGEAIIEVPVLPENTPLNVDQFYGMLDGLGKLEAFMDAIETVTPISKKLTCRNQFNNSSSFTWDMVLITMVAPIVWGPTWRDDIGNDWVAASAL